jgi:hypothetical protein
MEARRRLDSSFSDNDDAAIRSSAQPTACYSQCGVRVLSRDPEWSEMREEP